MPTYVVGGRGYWAQQQVRDLLAYLARARQPARRASRSTRCSPRRSAASPATRSSCSRLRARASGRDPWWTLIDDADAAGALDAAGPPHASRTLRALVRRRAPDGSRGMRSRRCSTARHAHRLRPALLRLAGGARRMANVRKLMRLAREYEAEEGRDLRGFIDLVGAPRRRR